MNESAITREIFGNIPAWLVGAFYALAFAALLHIAAAPKEDLEYRFNLESGALLESLHTGRPRHPGAPT